MCGIAGIVGPGAARHRDRVDVMLDALGHRGPDQRGTWIGPDAVLGCARLAVIDPEHGTQPIVSPDGDVVVVGNGELYGHRRIRDRYPRHPFGSGSDMEVVVPLWQEYGTRAVEHLPGTFAVAVYDRASSTLLLARDAFGERPLYWAPFGDGLVAFASEPRALIEAGVVGREPDPVVLADALRIGYVPPGTCVWKGMSSLPPAHLLELPVGRGRRPMVRRWWWPPATQVDRSPADAAEWLREHLELAVVEQLEADVPVGIFLSGGLDSSAVGLLAARHHPDITAFTLDMPTDSEASWARRVAERHGLTLEVCSPDEGRIAEELVTASRSWGEPFGDSSALVTWLLARRAREQVTVVLTGDGADELLGGYACWARPALAAGDGVGAVDGVGGHGSPRWRRSWRRPRPEGSAVARAYRHSRSYFSPRELVSLGLPERSVDDVDTSNYQWGTVEDICRFDVDWYLPGDILVKTDRASMAHSLEVRAPFLDRQVAEGCLAMPPHLKVDDHREKLVLREAFAAEWPEGLADRPKQGFGAPMDRWLALPAMKALVGDLLGDPAAPVFDLLDHGAVQGHLATGGQSAWTLVMVALWWMHHGSSDAR